MVVWTIPLLTSPLPLQVFPSERDWGVRPAFPLPDKALYTHTQFLHLISAKQLSFVNAGASNMMTPLRPRAAFIKPDGTKPWRKSPQKREIRKNLKCSIHTLSTQTHNSDPDTTDTSEQIKKLKNKWKKLLFRLYATLIIASSKPSSKLIMMQCEIPQLIPTSWALPMTPLSLAIRLLHLYKSCLIENDWFNNVHIFNTESYDGIVQSFY